MTQESMDEEPDKPTKSVRQMAKERYTLLSPRFWHGMTLGVWGKLLARHRFAISPTRIPAAAAITAASCMNSTFAGLEHLFYSRKVRQTIIDHPPIFIIGHWRSGTTMMHELLVRDARHTFPNTCHCFAPSHFLLTEWLIMRCLGFVMPKKRPMDDMDAGWGRPQEDEFALCNLGIPSPYLFLAYPSDGPVYDEYFTLGEVSEPKRIEWQQTLERFLKKLTLRDNKRIVLKSPTHTGRVRVLSQLFPDAKFIHLVRHPFTLYPSTIRLWQSLTYIQAVRLAKDDAWLEKVVLDNLATMYEDFESDRSLLGPSQMIDVRYEDLVADPIGQLRTVYDQLELGGFDEARPAVDEYVQSKKDYRANRHELPEATRKAICDRWKTYFDRHGYDRKGT